VRHQAVVDALEGVIELAGAAEKPRKS